MKTINVLVLGVGGNVSQGIISAIRLSNLNCKIIGACINENSLGLYFCDTAYISPYANDPIFIEWLIDICNKENIDIVLTGVEENLIKIAENIDDFKQNTNAIFISSPYDKLKIGQNKLSTVQFLKEHYCNYPKFANISDEASIRKLIEDVGYPLIAKPNSGKGSFGIEIIHSDDELLKLKDKDYCLQELLGNNNEEYTIGCYVNKQNHIENMIILHRILKHGTTFMAEIVQNESIENECRKICKEFTPIGPLNIQLRMHDNKPTCFELNVRFSGTTPIRARWGYNDVEAMIREYVLNEEIEYLFNPLKSGKVYRYYNEAYIDIAMQTTLKQDGLVKNVAHYNNFIEIR